MDSAPDRVNQHGAGAIENVASGQLLVTRLQQVGGFTRLVVAFLLTNGEDGSHIEVNINVGGTVDRVIKQGIATDRAIFGNVIGVLHFLGSQATNQATLLKHRDKNIVGVEIHLFDGLALDVGAAREAQRIFHQTRSAQVASDELARQGNSVH